MKAYVFIDCDENMARIITNKLRLKPCVFFADEINGPHNIAAVIESPDSDMLAKTVVFDIRKIEGVNDVTVYLALDDRDEVNDKDNLNSA